MDSPFEVLGVARDAEEAEIERAYRRRVKEAHPDQGGSVREFRRVRAAYEQLTETDSAPALDDWPGGQGRPTEGGDVVEGRTGQRTPDADDAATDETSDPETRVEYIDYETIEDFGWDLDDPDLFAKAAEADLDVAAGGTFSADPDEYLLEAAEECGYTWPFACRGGACANCAVKVLEGDLSLPVNHVLPDEMVDCGIRLSCVGSPTTEELRVVFNVKHLPDLDELRLPPRPFEQAYAND